MAERPKPLDWTPDLVNRFWDGVSSTRLAELSFSRTAAPSVVSAVWKHLSPHGTHLDLGAGDGDLAAELVRNNLRIAAYEPSQERRKGLEGRFGDQVAFLGCVDRLDQTQFDVVLLCEVIEHVLEDEYGAFLSGLGQYVREGGKLIVTTPNSEDLELNAALCPVCNKVFHRWQHQRSFTASSLEADMEIAGFDQVVIHQIEFTSEFFERYRGFLRGEAKLPPRILSWQDAWRLSKLDRLRWHLGNRVRRLRRALRVILTGDDDIELIPDYVYQLLNDEPARVGAGTQLLYIGQKRSHSLEMNDGSRCETRSAKRENDPGDPARATGSGS
ncbi:MAG: class I SAM-dependent methyltransferase [Sphingobacteriia bacterium]|nr:class I SAM-dependent methyltransferase [Sphingobacteriia bacterium]NCC39739.1 class I SAM-dependent methyltransferase [Gammaproteobacteria bacterium]